MKALINFRKDCRVCVMGLPKTLVMQAAFDDVAVSLRVSARGKHCQSHLRLRPRRVAQVPVPCRIITGEERPRYRLNATPVAELAHQVRNLRSSKNIIARPHLVKSAEHCGSLMQVLPKTLK